MYRTTVTALDHPFDTTNTDTHDLYADHEERPMNPIISTGVVSECDGFDLRDREAIPPDSPRPPGPDARVEIRDASISGEPTDEESLAARAPVARCADGNGTLTGLFFSDHVDDIARAKAMCALCPLRLGCLAEAIEREEPWGVWGGELLSGGRIVMNKRPCGRPPKTPRPEVVFDEMGPVSVVA